MATSEVVDLLSQVVDKLKDILNELKEIKEELDWTKSSNCAAMVVKGLDEIESAVRQLKP